MKKMFLKRLLVLCIAGAVVFSTSACNRNYDKDERIEDEDDDDDDSEKLSKKDKDALEQIDDCLSKLYEEDADDTEEFLLVIEDSIQELKTVNKSACSESVRNLVKETEVLLECAKSLQEMVLDISNMVEDMDGIDIAEEALDIDSLVTTEQVNEAYGIILGQAEEIKAVRHSQFFEKILDNYVGIYEAYAAILVEQYYAINNNDYLSIYSNQCLIKELMVEMQELNKDIERMGEESTKHIEAVSERFTGICEEVAYNLKELQRGRNKGLEFTYLEENKKITASIDCIDVIYPAMYNRLDAVSILTLSCAQEDYDVLVSVEVEGYSQKYEKTVTLGIAPQRLYIKPPVLKTGINLDSQTDTQLKVTVADVETGKTLVSETQNIKIMSINDFILNNDEFGYSNRADVLAWVTPESAYIQEVLRNAAVYMGKYTGHESIPGYQYISSEINEANTTAYQVYAIQKAISDMGVRYVMSSYSIGEAENATQRVNRPDETLSSKSGICIETSVLMASALQAAGMNAMIVLTTGHCQVAVETWENSGDYILIETTLLPVGNPLDMCGDKNYLNSLMELKSDEKWKSYLEAKNGEVFNCNLATDMGIIPLIY